MFNNRQSRRRFRLGNLARLVQLRQSVSNQPPQSSLPPKDLQEVLLQSPPQSPAFQPPPYHLESPMASPSTLPPSISKPGENHQSSPRLEPKSSPRSPAFQTQLQSPLLLPPSNQFSSPMPPPPTTLPQRPEPKASSPSLLSPKSKEESQPQTTTPSTSKPPPSSQKPSLSQRSHLRSVPPQPPETKSSPQSPAFQPQPQSPSILSPSSPMPSPSTLAPSFTVSGENRRSPSRLIPEPKSREVLQPQKTSPSTSKLPLSPQKQIDSLPPSVPPPSLTPEAKKLQSHPSTLKATLEYRSPPSSTPSKSIDETRFLSQASLSESHGSQVSSQYRSLSASQASPPSLLKSAESPPPETKAPSSPLSTLKAHKEEFHLSDETHFQSQASPQLSSPSKSGEHQAPPEAKIPPSILESRRPLAPADTETPKSSLKAAEESLSEPPAPSKATLSQSSLPWQALPQSLPESGESQLPLPPTETKTPQSTLDAAEEPQSQPPPPLGPSIHKTRLQESPRPPEVNVTPSTLNTSKEFTPPPLLSPDGTLSQSSPPWRALSETSESQLHLPPPETKTPPQLPPIDKTSLKSSPEAKITPQPPSKINTTQESIDETPFQSLPPSRSPKLPREAKTPPSNLNASKESHVQPLPPSKTIDPSSLPLIEKPKSTPHTHSSPSLSPKTTKKLQSQSPVPPLPSPTALTSPPSLPLTKPINTESHTSKDHTKDRNKQDAQLMKIPAEITGEVTKHRRKEMTNTVPTMMMFVNSNVQGINTSLSLDSSSIDHDPGVHLTIDYDDFSSLLL